MKAAFLYWPAAWASGHGAFQASLLEGLLAQDEHEVTVIAADDAGPIDVPPPHRLVRFRRRPRAFHALVARDAGTEWAAAKAIRGACVDAVIAWANFPNPVIDELPQLALLHETDFLEDSPWHWFPARPQQAMAEVTVRSLTGATAVFSNSQYTADRAVREFGIRADRSFVTSPAVRPFPSLGPQPPVQRPYVAQVGWFHARKNLPFVLNAWARARAAGMEHHLVLIGRDGPTDPIEGTLGRQILEHAGCDLAGDVHVVGLVDRAEYGRLLADAAALLVASYQEGFCIPVIEAFSLGTPVVAVARTALIEVAGPVGTLVEADPQSFADAMRRVAANPPERTVLQAYASRFTSTSCAAPLIAAMDAIQAHQWPEVQLSAARAGRM